MLPTRKLREFSPCREPFALTKNHQSLHLLLLCFLHALEEALPKIKVQAIYRNVAHLQQRNALVRQVTSTHGDLGQRGSPNRSESGEQSLLSDTWKKFQKREEATTKRGNDEVRGTHSISSCLFD